MIDTITLRESTDMHALAENDTTLKRKTAKESAGPCPFCGGTDRFSVNTEYNKWMCRNCTKGKWQDSIAYIQRREGCAFLEACDFLGGTQTLPARQRVVAPPSPPVSTAPGAQWQANARMIVDFCAANLWTDIGLPARDYLHKRGLNDDTIRLWNLGYLQGKPGAKENILGLQIPYGITIPGGFDDSVWYVKVRVLADVLDKYPQVPGSKAALFGADKVTGKRAVIVTEGEFDAMLLRQECGDLVDVVTAGSCTNHPKDEMLDCLLPATEWFIAYDLDKSGEEGAKWWTDNYPRARRVFIPKIAPHVKDITDFYLAGGNLREWVMTVIGYDEPQTEIKPTAPAADPLNPDAATRAQWDVTLAEHIAQAKRDVEDATRNWNEFADALDQVRAMGAENTPEFDTLLSEWEKLDAKMKAAQDHLDCLELTKHIRESRG